MSELSEAGHRNRLAEATSPYLRQHAANPVDWYEWGPEALERARRDDRPILLSIGYSACHWCHVMAHESFEDPATAALMNEHFVNIKVDREERPDLDEIYMAATMAMNGQGGWPMTVILTPDHTPFFTGTYFPPEDRYGRPGFKTLLREVARVWRDDRARALEVGEQVTAFLRQAAQAAPGSAPGPAELSLAVAQCWASFDARHGGFGSAPKFPPAETLRVLLRTGRRFADERSSQMARVTLDAMARGGIYDQLAGGFCRYSTDERWLVPHFEKMLYDNALLARAYLEASVALDEPFFARIARETLDYVLREMTHPQGGFYSATDADSEGEEGKFFVWTPAQLREALSEREAELFGAYYDVQPGGNWEGKSILNTPRSLEEVAKVHGLAADELQRILAEARAKLYQARLKRVAPGLDDKILVAWNSLMISALVEGGWTLGDRRYVVAAQRAADFLLAHLHDGDGRLLRSWREGTARLPGVLEDYSYFAAAMIDLYEAGAGEQYLRHAERAVGQLRERFQDPDGGFYSTATDHERLIVRHREGHDGATPSAGAVAAAALARLSFHLGRDDLRAAAVAALGAYGAAIAAQPRAFAASLLTVDFLIDGPLELVLAGAGDDPALRALQAEAARRFLPNKIVAWVDPATTPSTLPLPAGKALVGGRPALYVCRDFACRQPVTEPGEVGAALG